MFLYSAVNVGDEMAEFKVAYIKLDQRWFRFTELAHVFNLLNRAMQQFNNVRELHGEITGTELKHQPKTVEFSPVANCYISTSDFPQHYVVLDLSQDDLDLDLEMENLYLRF